MKLRDSAMPEEAYWETLLRPDEALDQLGVTEIGGNAVEFGCGYGTFTLPLAARVAGTLWTFDIEPTMAARTGERALAAGLGNVRTEVRDLFAAGTGLPDASVDLVVIFNLLHCEEPARLLAEAHRLLALNGVLAVMHWNWDAGTPRGPSLTIRPQPVQLRQWGEAAGFTTVSESAVDLPPYHYGWRLIKVP